MDQSNNEKLRDHFERRYTSMETERQSFLSHWQDIADHTSPRMVRINKTNDQSKGAKYNQKIIDPTATLASRTLRSGLMSGLTSPARPWFKLGTTDPQLQEFGPVKAWLYDVETIMRDILTKSNLYQVLPSVYGSLGDFGTAAMSAEEDDHSTIRFRFYLIGSYLIAMDERNRCDTLYRRYPMTVRQIVRLFKLKNCSPNVQQLYTTGQYEAEVEITHCIEPNTDRDATKFSNDNKPWRSVKYEVGVNNGLILSNSGYDEFPCMCPRWDLFDDSCYGYSPGMDALGTNKALQLADKRESQAIDKWVNPSMLGDSSLRTQRTSTLPGDITYIDGLAQQAHAGLRPLYQVNPDVDKIDIKIQRYQQFIKRCYFEDMMSMLAQSDNPEMTAREIEERHSEKVLILGPVMERLNDELFDPLIKRVFSVLFRQGLIKPPPQELQNQEFPQKIEYTSILAQAAKLLGTANIEKVARFTSELTAIFPEAKDKFDVDEAIDTYADMHGINPNIIRTADAVKPIRDQRAKQEQMSQMAAMAQPAQQAAQAAKTTSEIPGVSDLMQTMTGAANG
jgi:hypothetical protein